MATKQLKAALAAGVSLNVICLFAGAIAPADAQTATRSAVHAHAKAASRAKAVRRVNAPVATAAPGTIAATGAVQAPRAVAPAADSDAHPFNAGPETVTVTSQRRKENLERVPATIQAFTGRTLTQINASTLNGLLKYTPNVTFGNNGPGQGEIYLRGLSTGFRGNQSSATIGSFPNVAVYLDDQPMQFPARNLDIYMVDMQRVEVLEGPQGTLFGGGAEAGAVRYITNKPDLKKASGNIEGQYGFTSGGADNNIQHGIFNLPIIKNKLAIRGVVYNEHQGGYIENVNSTFTRSNADYGNYYLGLSPNAQGKCPNGLPAVGNNGCTVAPNSRNTANNKLIAGRNSNPTDYTGGRLSALWDINDDWNLLISESLGKLDTQGLSVEYPTGSNFEPLKPLQVTAFTPSFYHDHYSNTAWTLNGKAGVLHLIYTGGYTDRQITQQMDYTNYSRTGPGTYYSCTGGSTGWGTGPANCYSPATNWHDKVHNTHLSNEIRVASPDSWRLRFIAGAYQEDFKIYDVMNFQYKTVPSCSGANLAVASATNPCIANVRTDPNSTSNSPGIRGDNVGFGEDVQRGYDQVAGFGSVDFDIIPKKLIVTGGTRWYNYSENEVGSVYETSTGCLNVPNGQCSGGLININSHHDKVVYRGFKNHVGLTWHPTTNSTVYYTFSQGFRPGAFNRLQKAVIKDASGAPQYLEPNSYRPDTLTNNEIGFKGMFFHNRLMLNLSAYDMDWNNVQFLLYNPTQGINTTFGLNGANYNVKGAEFQWVGRITDDLTLQGSASYNNARSSNSPCLSDNEPGTAAYGKCITTVKLSNGTIQPLSNPYGAKNSVLPFSPFWQGNIRLRYQHPFGQYLAHVMVGGNLVGSMWNQPADYPTGQGVLIPTTTYLRYKQPGYGTLDASVGVDTRKWYAEVYGSNLLDSHASTFTSSAQFIESKVPLRPTVIMMKLGANF